MVGPLSSHMMARTSHSMDANSPFHICACARSIYHIHTKDTEQKELLICTVYKNFFKAIYGHDSSAWVFSTEGVTEIASKLGVHQGDPLDLLLRFMSCSKRLRLWRLMDAMMIRWVPLRHILMICRLELLSIVR